MTTVTVSIVSHGHGSLIADLLQDLSRQTFAAELDVTLTINIPEAGPNLDSCQALRVTTVHNDHPKGFGANHNAALRTAATPWVMIINPDIRIDDEVMIESLVRHGSVRNVGLVAPLIRNSSGEREDSIRHNLDPFSLFGRTAFRRKAMLDPRANDGRFQWVAGMFMALPLAVWKALDGFDERFFLYCEDYDLCARLSARGYAIEIDQTTEAIHDARRSSRRSFRFLRWHVASLTKVWRTRIFWQIWASDLRILVGPTPKIPNRDDQ